MQVTSYFPCQPTKKHLSPQAVPNLKLPLINPDGTILLEPGKLLEHKLIPRAQWDIHIPVVRWLIKWSNLPESEETWEDTTFIQKGFPTFQP